jgi:type III pantothenate kinase
MNLVIDSGNTRLKAGVFDGRRLNDSKDFFHGSLKPLNDFIAAKNPERLIVSDVTGKLNSKKIHAHKALFLSEKTPLPVSINYKPLKNLGKDRICNAVAADALFPGLPVLIIDCGTALKMDLIVNKKFTGGSIAPGMMMRYSSLHRHTAALPLLKPKPEFYALGNTTSDSIISGVQFGMLSEMENRIRIHRKDYRNLKVLLTGGDWHWFVNQLKYSIFAAPELTLIGLNEILLFQK